MSKYVKNLIVDHVRGRLQGVGDALLVDVIGVQSGATVRLRAELRKRNIHLLAVKNSLAARAVAGTSLAPMFDSVTGCSTICWGAEDIVSLAKEITRLTTLPDFAPFATKGGVMEGAKLSPAEVAEVSKWPSRTEQLSLLVGQILGPGARLAAQLNGPGGALASQIKQKAEGEEVPAECADAPNEGAEAPDGGEEATTGGQAASVGGEETPPASVTEEA